MPTTIRDFAEYGEFTSQNIILGDGFVLFQKFRRIFNISSESSTHTISIHPCIACVCPLFFLTFYYVHHRTHADRRCCITIVAIESSGDCNWYEMRPNAIKFRNREERKLKEVLIQIWRFPTRSVPRPNSSASHFRGFERHLKHPNLIFVGRSVLLSRLSIIKIFEMCDFLYSSSPPLQTGKRLR